MKKQKKNRKQRAPKKRRKSKGSPSPARVTKAPASRIRMSRDQLMDYVAEEIGSEQCDCLLDQRKAIEAEFRRVTAKTAPCGIDVRPVLDLDFLGKRIEVTVSEYARLDNATRGRVMKSFNQINFVKDGMVAICPNVGLADESIARLLMATEGKS